MKTPRTWLIFFIVTVILTIIVLFASTDRITALQERIVGSDETSVKVPSHFPKWDNSPSGTTPPSKDGSLPVGVWSQTIQIPPGCKTHFDAGNGTIYKVRLRLYSSAWSEHDGKSNIKGDQIQFMILQPGVTKLPYTLNCPNQTTQGSTPLPTVVVETITIPAMGKLTVTKQMNCYMHGYDGGPTDEITRTEQGDVLIFTSTKKQDTKAKVWFFQSHGRSCKEDYQLLYAQNAFR